MCVCSTKYALNLSLLELNYIAKRLGHPFKSLNSRVPITSITTGVKNSGGVGVGMFFRGWAQSFSSLFTIP